MTKKLLLAAALLPVCAGAYAQQQEDMVLENEPGVIEQIAKIEKKTDKFNLFFNMHADFRTDWTNQEFNGGKFEIKQFRIEAKGRINKTFSYHYRQRLTKADIIGATDNFFQSVDIAGIGMNFGKWNLFLGKQCADYGGFEYDLNPIEIYQYSDMIEYMSNFMTGVNVSYNFTPRQQLQFQILDAIDISSSEKYGAWQPSKLPLTYILNWNGNFNDVYKTRWSASVMNETHKNYMYYVVLGNEFKLSDKVQMYFDVSASYEDIDRKGIITEIVGKDYLIKNNEDSWGMSRDTGYLSFVWHGNWRLHPKWNLFAKMMVEMEGVVKNHKGMALNGSEYPISKGNYRTALGYIGGVEFYPFKDRNLHFFATYVGRNYLYTDRAKAFGAADYTTNRASVGFIWQMPVF